MEEKYVGIVCKQGALTALPVCKYSSRYVVSCRKFLLNNCFNQIPRTLVPVSSIWQSCRRRPNLLVNMKNSCHGKRICG